MVTFTLLQWNTLAKEYADKEFFPYVDEKYLKWDFRSPLLHKIIKENEPDIICFEEVSNYEEFIQQVISPLDIKYDILYQKTKNQLIGILLGVNKSKFSIIKQEHIVLKGDKEGNESGQILISSIIKDIKTNEEFCVIVTHLKSKEKNEDIRLCQTEHLMKYIEDNIKGKYPLFLVGDFNAEPSYSCINNLMNNEKIKMKSAFDFSKLEFSTIKVRDKLYKRIIDYIFYTGKKKDNNENEIKVESNEKGRPNIDEKIGLPNENFPSDHLFLKAKITLSFN